IRLAGEAEGEASTDDPTEVRPIAPTTRGRIGRAFRRRELPADTVRRWYAEMLLTLENFGLPKPSWQTPGEFLRTVAVAYPEAVPGFEALTRAYEDVRYGRTRLSTGLVSSLRDQRTQAEEAVRRAGPVPAP